LADPGIRGLMRIELRLLEPGEPDRAESFLQSSFWGRFKSGFGWKALRCAIRLLPTPDRNGAEGAATEGQLLVLERSLGALFGFAYVPHGPEIVAPAGDRGPLLAAIAEALRPLLSPRCLFVRFDPPWYEVGEITGRALMVHVPKVHVPKVHVPKVHVPKVHVPKVHVPKVHVPKVRQLRRAAYDVQSPDTVIIDLRPSEDEILAAMKPKWRYNIRLADKKGVVVGEAGLESVAEFYSMYRETASRDRIEVRNERYYAALFEAALGDAGTDSGSKTRPDLRLWFARHEGQALASIVTLFRGKRAVYLYGASRDAKRNLMPTYALQWAAMRAAKAAGCEEYDLFGIPPSEDPTHPMAGLYRFKTGFGGSVAHRAGSWDYAYRPLVYGAFRAAEAVRAWYYKDFRKRGRGAGSKAAE
jgi:lipid II:glycine glycyltransferase (peptidoglycan interpeptide bridge formation enzyme)